MSRRKKWIWQIVGISAAILLVLVLVARSRSRAATRDSLRPVLPLPDATAEIMSFVLTAQVPFYMDENENIEMVVRSRRQIIRSGPRIVSLSEPRSVRRPFAVAIPPRCDAFRVSKVRFDDTNLFGQSTIDSLPDAIGAMIMKAWSSIVRQERIRTTWSPWLVKTNGMWVEMGADYQP